jgi:hypothetical protein
MECKGWKKPSHANVLLNRKMFWKTLTIFFLFSIFWLFFPSSPAREERLMDRMVPWRETPMIIITVTGWSLKGPKHEIFGPRFITPSKPNLSRRLQNWKKKFVYSTCWRYFRRKPHLAHAEHALNVWSAWWACA